VGLATLPEALCLDGDLRIEGCTNLTALPDGLILYSARSLPNGLIVRDLLELMLCPVWDGRISDNTKIGKEVRTDGHSGVSGWTNGER
jgi:hypothetical protein